MAQNTRENSRRKIDGRTKHGKSNSENYRKRDSVTGKFASIKADGSAFKGIAREPQRVRAGETMQSRNVDDDTVNRILEHRLKAHAPLWTELSKR